MRKWVPVRLTVCMLESSGSYLRCRSVAIDMWVFMFFCFRKICIFSRNSVDLDPCAVFPFTNTLEPVWEKVFARHRSTTFSERRHCIELLYTVIFCNLYGKSFSSQVGERHSWNSCSQRKCHVALKLSSYITWSGEIRSDFLQWVQEGGFRFNGEVLKQKFQVRL